MFQRRTKWRRDETNDQIRSTRLPAFLSLPSPSSLPCHSTLTNSKALSNPPRYLIVVSNTGNLGQYLSSNISVLCPINPVSYKNPFSILLPEMVLKSSSRTCSRAREYSWGRSRRRRVSRESMMVAPQPLNGEEERPVLGLTSSWPGRSWKMNGQLFTRLLKIR